MKKILDWTKILLETIFETVLREGNLVQKILKHSDAQNIVDLATAADGLDTKLISIHRDGKLNLWSTKERKIIASNNLFVLDGSIAEKEVSNLRVRFAQNSFMLIACAQLPERAKVSRAWRRFKANLVYGY